MFRRSRSNKHRYVCFYSALIETLSYSVLTWSTWLLTSPKSRIINTKNSTHPIRSSTTKKKKDYLYLDLEMYSIFMLWFYNKLISHLGCEFSQELGVYRERLG